VVTLDPLAPGLDELVNSQLPESRVVPLDGVGEASAKVFERAGNESRTRPLVAANFWQAYVNSRAYERDLLEHSLYQVDVSLVDAQIVADTRGRFTLLVESDKVEDPVTFRASAEPDELEVGWFRANEARDSREQDALRQLLPSQRLWRSPPPAQVRDTWQLTPELSIEAGASQDFFVIIVALNAITCCDGGCIGCSRQRP
jgi:hypothetical protein